VGIEFDGKDYPTDASGYLLSPQDWDEALAAAIARAEGIELAANHWEVINFVRSYYDEFLIAPAIRVLIKAIGKKLGPEKGNSTYLYQLFPEGPALQACKIAGLPKPTGCV
jgi:tRNA 2-thiouridine synthesizing protein E